MLAAFAFLIELRGPPPVVCNNLLPSRLAAIKETSAKHIKNNIANIRALEDTVRGSFFESNGKLSVIAKDQNRISLFSIMIYGQVNNQVTLNCIIFFKDLVFL